SYEPRDRRVVAVEPSPVMLAQRPAGSAPCVQAGGEALALGGWTLRAAVAPPFMRAQRPAGSAPCVQAAAEALPFGDGTFSAAMAVLTIHHWRDKPKGLGEMRRGA